MAELVAVHPSLRQAPMGVWLLTELAGSAQRDLPSSSSLECISTNDSSASPVAAHFLKLKTQRLADCFDLASSFCIKQNGLLIHIGMIF